MKNLLNILLCVIAFIFLYVVGLLIAQNASNDKTKNDFNIYAGKIIKGGEVTSIINKAINENEKNKIEKDENGYYIENENNSIKIFVVIGEQEFKMEDIHNNDTLKFIKNFNTVTFKCNNVEYHNNTGKIKKIEIEEIIN